MNTVPGQSPAARAAVRRASPDGVHRAARSRTCGRCQRPVFVGLDADAAAISVRVDARPLSAGGEVEALMSGRRTYALTWVAGRARYEINPREALDIAAFPPGSVAGSDVVSAHQCGGPDFDNRPAARRKNITRTESIDPPF